jgi:hypothetical protein
MISALVSPKKIYFVCDVKCPRTLDCPQILALQLLGSHEIQFVSKLQGLVEGTFLSCPDILISSSVRSMKSLLNLKNDI